MHTLHIQNSSSRHSSKDFKALLVVLLGLFLMGALSLSLLNTKSTLGVKLNQLSTNYEDLSEELQEISMQNAHATSLETITSSPVYLSMEEVTPDRVIYVQPVTLTAQVN